MKKEEPINYEFYGKMNENDNDSGNNRGLIQRNSSNNNMHDI